MADKQPDETVAGTPLAADEGDRLSVADHLLYAQQIYGQPSWVLEGVFQANGLDTTKNHAVSKIKKMLADHLAQPDKRYEEKR